MTIEQEIKDEFSKIFKSSDWIAFKQTADYYYKIAATLKKRDIDAPNGLKLWLRNVQKRLYIGIATELILKAIYLKNGFNINKPNKGTEINFPEKIENLNESKLNPSETYSLNQIIGELKKVINESADFNKILEGLKICKVFRNKEGHVAVHWHKFNKDDFSKIEYSISRIYEIGFSEKLFLKIAITKDDGKGKFEIKKYTL